MKTIKYKDVTIIREEGLYFPKINNDVHKTPDNYVSDIFRKTHGYLIKNNEPIQPPPPPPKPMNKPPQNGTLTPPKPPPPQKGK